MKKNCVTLLVSSIFIAGVVLVPLSVYNLSYNKNKMKSEEILKIAYEQIEENNQETTLENISTESVSENAEENIEMISNNDIIGVLLIPSLKIEAPIKEGTSQEVMKTSIGHFTESDYWNGNVSFASHNSGTSAHYFEKINKLNVNDEIEYITKLGTRTYKVQSIKKIESTDWSMVMKSDGQTQNKENTITLITCVTGQPDHRLCVRGVEI